VENNQKAEKGLRKEDNNVSDQKEEGHVTSSQGKASTTKDSIGGGCEISGCREEEGCGKI